MAKITRIKAKDPGKSAEEASAVSKAEKSSKKPIVKAAPEKKPEEQAKNKEVAASKKPAAKTSVRQKAKKPFILIRPFVAFGSYVHAAWLEIRQVRWPSRKATWKMVAAIFIYTGLFIAIIMLLDALFTWLFGIVLG